MAKRLTAGELSQKAASDTTKYNSLEMGYELAEGVAEQLQICAQNHMHIIDEPEFCVVQIIAKDPILFNVLRMKYYAWPFLPKPRPNQTVFLFKKADQSFKRLWALPCAEVMAELSTMVTVSKHYKSMKEWSDAFYDGKFFEFIRQQNHFDLLSEGEYLNLHREELIKSGCNEPTAPIADTFDFAKYMPKQIVDTAEVITE